MTIIDAQTSIISVLTDAGYTNIKDSMLTGITQSETYPIIVVDVKSSTNIDISSGGYTPFAHHLVISVYQKASIGVKEARESAVDTIKDILSILNLQIVENTIEYIDTVLNNIKICGAGCIVEVDAYNEISEYVPNLSIGSNPEGANVYIDGVDSGYITPCTINRAQNGTYNVVKTNYLFTPQVVSITEDDVIYFDGVFSPDIEAKIDTDGLLLLIDVSNKDMFYYYDDGSASYVKCIDEDNNIVHSQVHKIVALTESGTVNLIAPTANCLILSDSSGYRCLKDNGVFWKYDGYTPSNGTVITTIMKSTATDLAIMSGTTSSKYYGSKKSTWNTYGYFYGSTACDIVKDSGLSTIKTRTHYLNYSISGLVEKAVAYIDEVEAPSRYCDYTANTLMLTKIGYEFDNDKRGIELKILAIHSYESLEKMYRNHLEIKAYGDLLT